MLKLLLVTLGTWSLVSLFLVGALGFLIQLRELTTCAMAGRTGAKFRGAGGRMARISRVRGSDEEKRNPPVPRAARTAS
jgi:hypothetical protein